MLLTTPTLCSWNCFLLYAIDEQIVPFMLLYCMLLISVPMHRSQFVIKNKILHQAKHIESHRKIIISTKPTFFLIENATNPITIKLRSLKPT